MELCTVGASDYTIILCIIICREDVLRNAMFKEVML